MMVRARFAEVAIRALLSKRGPGDDDDDDDEDDDDLFSSEADANSLDDMAAHSTKGLRDQGRGGGKVVRAKLKSGGGPGTEWPVAPKVKLKLKTQVYEGGPGSGPRPGSGLDSFTGEPVKGPLDFSGKPFRGPLQGPAKGEPVPKPPVKKYPKSSRSAEVAPPGMEPVVKALKRKKGITNPFAVAWSMHNKAKRKRASEAAAWWLFRRGYAGPLINQRAIEVFLTRQGMGALDEFQAFLEKVEAAPISVGAALVRPGARPLATVKDPQGHMSTVAVPKKSFRQDLQRKLRLRKVMQPERPGNKPPKAQGVPPGKVASA